MRYELFFIMSLLVLALHSCENCQNCTAGFCNNCSSTVYSLNCTCFVANCANCSGDLTTCYICSNGYKFDTNQQNCFQQEVSSTNWSIVAIIIITVVVLIIVLIVIILYAKMIYHRTKLIVHPEILDNSSQSSSIKIKIKKELNFIDYPQKKQVCGICLKNDLNVVTNCGHFFHYECLRLRYLVNKKCKKCKKTIQPIKLLCNKCLKFTKKIAICKKSCNETTHLNCQQKNLKACSICQNNKIRIAV